MTNDGFAHEETRRVKGERRFALTKIKWTPFVKTQIGSKLKEFFPFRLSEIGVAAVVVVAVGEVVSPSETSKPALGLSTSSTALTGSLLAALS